MVMLLPDREILEKIIIPYFDKGNVCFVGIDKHTYDYINLFKNTVDILEINSKHILHDTSNVKFRIGSVLDIGKLYDKKFDCVIANGLASYGLNCIQAVKQAFEAIYEALDNLGVLVWGWSQLLRAAS